METHTLRVYYEDTDLAGIVYYANYLKFLERGRTEAIRAVGIDQRALKETEGVVFVVRRVELDYHAPARFDDVLTVATATSDVGYASVTMRQGVWLGATLLVGAVVKMAALGADGRVSRFPDGVRTALAQLAAGA
ncbi:MAG: tol-pal system-associated acyl-CoA thioesterase [Pseudomonadota bacterium]